MVHAKGELLIFKLKRDHLTNYHQVSNTSNLRCENYSKRYSIGSTVLPVCCVTMIYYYKLVIESITTFTS